MTTGLRRPDEVADIFQRRGGGVEVVQQKLDNDRVGA